jgi:hypothetical protein
MSTTHSDRRSEKNATQKTIVFIAKYLFIGSVKILNKIVYKIAIKFISKSIKVKKWRVKVVKDLLQQQETEIEEKRLKLNAEKQ